MKQAYYFKPHNIKLELGVLRNNLVPRAFPLVGNWGNSPAIGLWVLGSDWLLDRAYSFMLFLTNILDEIRLLFKTVNRSSIIVINKLTNNQHYIFSSLGKRRKISNL